jgi:uncharacterized protein YjbI with pentapeptide repeats
MKTIKPFRLGVLPRPYRWQGRDHLGVAVLALVELADAPRLLPEQTLWKLAGEEAGGVLDLGVPKAFPEVLATGYAYTRHQRDDTACGIRLKVDGILDKSLLVFGDRYWVDGKPDAPRPFEAMRVDWTRAYGGPGHAANPVGIGAVDEVVNGVRVRRVPNIESPHERLSAPSQSPTPAGFGALGMDWSTRARHLGTRYDQAWLEQDYPGFAADTDWRLFNAAPPDQWAASAHAAMAGAPYEIWHMHPDRPVLRGRVPDWRARCFVSRDADGDALEEIPLSLSTAWFFPHRECMVLIWHGRADLREDDAADIRYLMPALERPDQPRDTAHYAAVLARRLDPRRGAVHALLDEDLVPRDLCGPWLDSEMRDEADRPSRRNLRAGARRRHAAARADLLAQGLDPDKYLPPEVEDEPAQALADLPAWVERMEREQDEARRGEGETARAYTDAALPALAAVAGVDLDGLRKLDESPPGGGPAPAFDPAALRRQLRDAGGHEDARLSAMLHDAYLDSAQHYAAPPPMTPHRARRTRSRLQARQSGDRNAAGMQLAGADLSGMDLSGMDFRRAVLAGADLSGARLDGCDFSEAVLAAARLDGASARGARFVGANLGGVRCRTTDFHGADLSQARLDQAVCEECDFGAVTVRGGCASKTLFRSCDFGGAGLSQWAAMNVVVEHCGFRDAVLEQCAWLQCALRDCDFAAARLSRVAFTQCRFDGALSFARARLEGCAFAGGAGLTGVSFVDAVVSNSSLRGAVMEGADLSGAQLQACDLSECTLRDARLDRVRAPRSLFVRADFQGASLRGADLIEAILAKADLLRADLGEANLFRADVSQARMDASTGMRGAYTEGVKRYPLRRAEPVA